MNYEALEELLKAPLVVYSIFLELQVDGVFYRYHQGVGDVELNGHTWHGAGNPLIGQVVKFSGFEKAEFGTYPKLEITVEAVPREFLKQLLALRYSIEGSPATVYQAFVDQETGQADFRPYLIGRITSPSYTTKGLGAHTLTISVESQLQGLKFPFARLLNHSTQQEDYQGDLALQFQGQKIAERIS